MNMDTEREREEKLATLRQTHQLMATITANIDWSRIPSGAIQELIRDPEHAGQLVTAFIAQGLSAAPANEPFARGIHGFRPHWGRDGNVIYARMVSTGWLAEEWGVWCRENGYRLLNSVEQALHSGKFKVTPAGTIREIAIIVDHDHRLDGWTAPMIDNQAKEFRFQPADLETVFLFRKSFSNKELKAMGPTWFVAAHEPLDEEGSQLTVGTNDDGRWIGLVSPMKSGEWPHYSSFIYNHR